PTPAGGSLLVYPRAAGRLEGTDLGGGVLVAGLRDAGVAEQHGKMSPKSVAFGDDLATGLRATQALVFACREFPLRRRSFEQRREWPHRRRPSGRHQAQITGA